MLWYSIKVPQRGASDEYPQHKFFSEEKEHIDTFYFEKKK